MQVVKGITNDEELFEEMSEESDLDDFRKSMITPQDRKSFKPSEYSVTTKTRFKTRTGFGHMNST